MASLMCGRYEVEAVRKYVWIKELSVSMFEIKVYAVVEFCKQKTYNEQDVHKRKIGIYKEKIYAGVFTGNY